MRIGSLLSLFIGASITDYIDGYLARKWSQQSAFGTMLDPIADKAMVILAILAIIGLYGLKTTNYYTNDINSIERSFCFWASGIFR